MLSVSRVSPALPDTFGVSQLLPTITAGHGVHLTKVLFFTKLFSYCLSGTLSGLMHATQACIPSIPHHSPPLCVAVPCWTATLPKLRPQCFGRPHFHPMRHRTSTNEVIQLNDPIRRGSTPDELRHCDQASLGRETRSKSQSTKTTPPNFPPRCFVAVLRTFSPLSGFHLIGISQQFLKLQQQNQGDPACHARRSVTSIIKYFIF